MDDFLNHPQKYSFFQVIRLLQSRALRKKREKTRRSKRGVARAIGEDAYPADENVRIKVSQSLNSQPSEVQSLKPIKSNEATPERYELTATLMGLTGVHGILPHHYTALIMSRLRKKDPSFRNFLDLFNHRILSFFYRVWEKKNLPVMLERDFLQQNGIPDSLYLEAFYSLLGKGTKHLTFRQSLPDQFFLAYAGLFVGQTRPAEGLKRILKTYFRIPVEIEQFSGRWLSLQPENRSRLPGDEKPKGQFNTLGNGLILGRRVWDVQSKVRLIIGPVRQEQFRRYLPDGDLLKPICEAVRSYLGPDLEFDLLLKVNRPTIETSQLNSIEGAKYRLGWNSWIKSNRSAQGLTEVIFSSGSE